MKPTEMRLLGADELHARIGQWQQELYRMRCSQVIGQGSDTSRIVAMRRQIARANTIIHEKRRDAASQA